MDFLKQFVPVRADEVPSKVFGLLSQDFGAIEFRAVRRWVVQVQPFALPIPTLFLHHVVFVNSGIVEDDDVRLIGQLLKKIDHVCTGGGMLQSGPLQLTIVTQCTQHIDALSPMLSAVQMHPKFIDSLPQRQSLTCHQKAQ